MYKNKNCRMNLHIPITSFSSYCLCSQSYFVCSSTHASPFSCKLFHIICIFLVYLQNIQTLFKSIIIMQLSHFKRTIVLNIKYLVSDLHSYFLIFLKYLHDPNSVRPYLQLVDISLKVTPSFSSPLKFLLKKLGFCFCLVL